MFEINTPTKAKVRRFQVLSTKGVEAGDQKGVKMVLNKIVASASMLAMLDPNLPTTFYKVKEAAQGALEGMAPEMEPTNIGLHIPRFPWVGELTGYKLTFIRAVTKIVLEDCRVYRIFVKVQEDGGACELEITFESPNHTDQMRGTLSGLESEEVEFTLVPPVLTEDEQQALDLLDKKKPAAKKPAPTEGTKPADWPFGKDGEPVIGAADRGGDGDEDGHDPEEGRNGESDPGEVEPPAEPPRRRRGKAEAATDATGAFVEAHAPRRRRGKGEAPAAH